MSPDIQDTRRSWIFTNLSILVTALVLCTPYILSSYFGFNYKSVWWYFDVDAYLPVFADLRGVLAPLECFEQGLELYRHNPCDPWGRPFNYPRVWLGLYYFGFDQGDSFWMGISLITGVLVSYSYLSGKQTLWFALISTLVLCSPPLLLAFERGNSDLLVFVVLALAVLLLANFNRFGSFLLLIAAVLKIYPCFAFAVNFYNRSRLGWKLLIYLGLFFGIYIFLTWSDLARINTATPDPLTVAYGAPVLFKLLKLPYADLASRCLAVVLIIAALAVGYKRQLQSTTSSLHVNSFIIGSSVFIGSFLLTQNYYYRLIFLLLSIPYLTAELGKIRVLTVVVLVGSLWFEAFQFTESWYLDEFFSWGLVVMLAYQLGQLLYLSNKEVVA